MFSPVLDNKKCGVRERMHLILVPTLMHSGITQNMQRISHLDGRVECMLDVLLIYPRVTHSMVRVQCSEIILYDIYYAYVRE
jgi:hypothetical protein